MHHIHTPPFPLQEVSEERRKLHTTIKRSPNCQVWDCGISPLDCNTVVTGANDHLAIVWDICNPEKNVIMRGHHGTLNSVGFSHSGEEVLTGSDDRTVRVWDAKQGFEKYRLVGHLDFVLESEFSADDNLVLSCGGDHTCVVWRLPPHNFETQILSHADKVSQATFSPDARLVASCGYDNMTFIWDVQTANVLQSWASRIFCCRFDHTGGTLVFGHTDGSILLYDCRTNAPLPPLPHYPSPVHDVAVCAVKPEIVCSHSGLLRKLDLRTMKQISERHCHNNGYVRRCRVSSCNSRIISSASNDNSCYIWDYESLEIIQIMNGHSYWTDDLTQNRRTWHKTFD